jgi:hypothetical protein
MEADKGRLYSAEIRDPVELSSIFSKTSSAQRKGQDRQRTAAPIVIFACDRDGNAYMMAALLNV